jgi:hypothetical protein
MQVANVEGRTRTSAAKPGAAQKVIEPQAGHALVLYGG